jgi:hypothetical protein
MQIEMSTDIGRGDARCWTLWWPSRRSAYTYTFQSYFHQSPVYIYNTAQNLSLAIKGGKLHYLNSQFILIHGGWRGCI